MAKRRSGGVNGDRTATRRRRHLYLVVDDWLWGYSIRKVDLSSDPCADEPPHLHNTAISGEGAEREQRLPPAVFRLEAHRGYPDYFAAAFGTKIIAMDPNYVGVGGRNTHPLTPSCGAPVFDVRTRLFGLVPRPKMNLINPIYFSVDKRLYALSCNSFQLLQTPPLEEPGDLCWCELPKYPFKHKDITSYTVHPDGRTIFVSTKRRTFTFDTAEAHLKWKQHGKWMLPFTDRAYFDSELDAWVGLSADPGAAGHICACDVVSSSSDSSDGQCLSWKLSKEKIFSEDSVEKHVGATLIYMGDRSKFCLVQCVSITGDDCADERNFYRLQDEEDEDLDETDQPCRHLFRVTTFSLKFDKDGHLTTGNSRRVRYYKVPEAASDFALEDPVAFWM